MSDKWAMCVNLDRLSGLSHSDMHLVGLAFTLWALHDNCSAACPMGGAGPATGTTGSGRLTRRVQQDRGEQECLAVTQTVFQLCRCLPVGAVPPRFAL
jgi:hypothetical protein